MDLVEEIAMDHAEDEAGITLVEIAVSLAILGLVLTAFFTVITGGLQSLSESRSRQAASQLATEIIESLRGAAPSEIALATSDFDLTTATFNCGGTAGEFDPDGDGVGCEAVRTSVQGIITRDSADPYWGSAPAVGGTVETYATDAEGTGLPDGTTRVTVVVEYSLQGDNEVVRRSALVSEVDRG